MPSVVRPSLPSGELSVLRTRRAEAVKLPHPDEAWTTQEVDLSHAALRKFEANGIVRRVGTTRVEVDFEGDEYTRLDRRPLWRTVAAAYHYVDERIRTADGSARNTLPCGHQGVRNLGGGEYTCLQDGCSETWDEATARAALGGYGSG